MGLVLRHLVCVVLHAGDHLYMDTKKKNRGQSLVEYVLILAVVVTVIMIAMLGRFQSKVSNMYNDVGNAMPAETGS